MALSWLNLPCALKAAIGIAKRTLGDPASLPRATEAAARVSALSRVHARSHGPNGGVADSLAQVKAAFRAAGERPLSFQVMSH